MTMPGREEARSPVEGSGQKKGRIVVRRSVTRGVVGTPKSGKRREVPLCAEAIEALRGHQHTRGPVVFSGPRGEMLDLNKVKWRLWSACTRAGLRRVGWHRLRHSFASHLVMRGAPIKAVLELLGHATIEMTRRYAHLAPDTRREVVGLLDAIGPGHGNTVAKHFGGV
jgi:integrase